jgi:SAM-dependent methyltransferase
MFKHRSTAKELMDDLTLSGEALRRNLEELEVINHWLGGYQVVTDALARLPLQAGARPRPLSITDLGCGGGDTLRVISRWARKKKLAVQLEGYDANAFMVEYASGKCASFPDIHLHQENIFSAAFQSRSFDVIICSLFCHHFTDPELIALFRQLHGQARVALIINDLHRHPLAYYGIKWLTWLFPCSYLVRYDAPLSVLRAFKRAELEEILHQAALGCYSLRWVWAFRWQIIIPRHGPELFKI